MALVVASLQQFFNSYPQITKHIVAFSGGLDSTVLLHAMRELHLPVHVVHVNHHLQQEANNWEKHCKNICNDLNTPISIAHVQADKISKSNVEESARKARYELLFGFVENQQSLVTAHHKNDVAETLLLQLLRGSGPAGLATMSYEREINFKIHLRPLLNFTRLELLEYAQENKLQWIEDVSNDSIDFDRNYLRKNIMPDLMERWPGSLQTLSRVVELQAEAIECLKDLASIDLLAARCESSNRLSVKSLQELSPARVKNALRVWMQEHQIRVPSRKVLNQICTDIVFKDGIETSPLQSWSEGEVRRFRDQLYLMSPLPAHDTTQEYQWNIDQPLYIESIGRTLQRSDLKRYGVKLPDDVQQLKVGFRCGGESLKPFGSNHHRSLKNLFQEANVPPWERERVPLLYYNDQLISVLGYWNAVSFCESSQNV